MNFKQLQKYCLREKTEFLHRYQKKKKKKPGIFLIQPSPWAGGGWRVATGHPEKCQLFLSLPTPGDWAGRAAAEESQGKSKMKIHLGKGMLPLCQLLERPSAPLASPF